MKIRVQIIFCLQYDKTMQTNNRLIFIITKVSIKDYSLFLLLCKRAIVTFFVMKSCHMLPENRHKKVSPFIISHEKLITAYLTLATILSLH